MTYSLEEFVIPSTEILLEGWGFLSLEENFDGGTLVSWDRALGKILLGSGLSMILLLLVSSVSDPDVDEVEGVQNHDVVSIKIFLIEVSNFFDLEFARFIGDLEESNFVLNWLFHRRPIGEPLGEGVRFSRFQDSGYLKMEFINLKY